jgi:hypothetical protein
MVNKMEDDKKRNRKPQKLHYDNSKWRRMRTRSGKWRASEGLSRDQRTILTVTGSVKERKQRIADDMEAE